MEIRSLMFLLWTPKLKDSDLMDIYFWMKDINYEWSLWLIIWSSFVESVEVDIGRSVEAYGGSTWAHPCDILT